MIFDFDTIKAQSQPPPTYPDSLTCENEKIPRTERKRSSYRHISPKIVTGPPKSLCLPRLHGLDEITSVLIVRHESPWDTYQRAISYDIAGEVTIASRRTRPRRMVAIRKYRREDARGLIDRFGRLEHVNILTFYECYLNGDSAFFLVADLPLTLAHVVTCSDLYPSETELGSTMYQVCPPWPFPLNSADIPDPRRYVLFSYLWPCASGFSLLQYSTRARRDCQDW